MKNQKQGKFQNIEAAYSENLSFWELMIFGRLYALIKPNDPDFCPYFLPLTDFLPAIDGFSAISNAAFRLLEHKIKWTYLDENAQEHLCQSNLLTSVDLSANIDAPNLVLTIHPYLQKALSAFKLDTKPLDFLQLPFLRMNTSLRLYTIILRNIQRNTNSFAILLEKLKDLLNVADKYDLYANFKIKVLEEAQKRLLADANLVFEFGEIKTGKKVTAIRFRIEKYPLLPFFNTDENEEILLPDVPNIEPEKAPIVVIETPIKTAIDKDLKQQIGKKLGVTQRMIRKLAEDFSEESLQQDLILTEKAIEKGSIKGSPAGFFVEAVRQNYQISEGDEQQKRQAEARQKAEVQAQIEAEQRQKREALKKQEFEQERDAILQELTNDTTLRQTIVDRIRYSIFHACYDVSKNFNQNLENPSFLAAVLNYYKIVKK